MPLRPRRTSANPGRANINIAGIASATGAGAPEVNPDYISPEQMETMTAVPATAQHALPYKSPGFWGRLAGNDADYRNANLNDARLTSQMQTGQAKELANYQDTLSAGAERRRAFANFSGGATAEEAPPEVVQAFKTGYAVAKSRENMTAAEMGEAENINKGGIARRNEEIGSTAHPYNLETTGIEGQTRVDLAKGRQGLTPLVINAERAKYTAEPYKQANELFQGSHINLGDGRLMSYDQPSGARKLTRIPSDESIMTANELGTPRPEVSTEDMDGGSIRLSDGSIIPRKPQPNAVHQSVVNGIQPLERSFTPPRTMPGRSSKPSSFAPSQSLTTPTVPQTPQPMILNSGGLNSGMLTPDAINIPEIGRRTVSALTAPFHNPFKETEQDPAGRYSLSIPEVLKYWSGRRLAPGPVGPAYSPPLPLPPNYR